MKMMFFIILFSTYALSFNGCLANEELIPCMQVFVKPQQHSKSLHPQQMPDRQSNTHSTEAQFMITQKLKEWQETKETFSQKDHGKDQSLYHELQIKPYELAIADLTKYQNEILNEKTSIKDVEVEIYRILNKRFPDDDDHY